MNMDGAILNYGEKIGFDLCALYRSYGYALYKMSKFEEYDLYANNKDFLISDQILTFTDLSGKLMALKPDVTLSIVRNSRDGLSGVKKVYYTENVYRAAKGSRSFKEILQAGLECIGDVDDYCVAEVLTLAAESLRRISPDSVLELSDLDILSAQIDRLGASGEQRQQILKCIADKNLHELADVCAAAGTDKAETEKLLQLAALRGTPEEVLPKLTALICAPEAAEQLGTLCAALTSGGYGDLLRIDLSLVSDMTYYNGIVFQGFVAGVPSGVLSGGRYDRLMRKMGKSSAAIGFAVYLDALERLNDDAPRFDVDTVLLYDESSDLCALSAAVKALTEQGISVSAQKCVPEKLKYRCLAKLNGSEVETLETNA